MIVLSYERHYHAQHQGLFHHHAPAMAREAERLAKKESRTMSELMCEAFRRYQTAAEAAQAMAALPRMSRQPAFEQLAQVVAEIRQEAKDKDIDKMPMSEINRAAAAARRGLKKSSKRPPT
jgi:L-amino acid N-acyltransferase YncA